MENASRVLKRVAVDEMRDSMVELSELKSFDLFSMFSHEQLREIGRIISRRAYKTDALIYRQGQPASELFLVERGLVSLRAMKSEGQMVISFELCEAGDLFGAASLLDGRFYTLDAVCLNNTDVLVINAGRLSQLCEDDYEFGYRLMKRIAQLYLDRYEVAQSELGIPVAARKADVS